MKTKIMAKLVHWVPGFNYGGTSCKKPVEGRGRVRNVTALPYLATCPACRKAIADEHYRLVELGLASEADNPLINPIRGCR